MSEPYLGEIRAFSFAAVPRGWAACNGQLLPIEGNEGLFSVIGTTYGGDVPRYFALPDLRGRVPVHADGEFRLGVPGGEETHRLTGPEMPRHAHPVRASTVGANLSNPANVYWAASTGDRHFSAQPPDAAMSPAAVLTVGGGAAHVNMQPFLILNFAIALQGIYPARN